MIMFECMKYYLAPPWYRQPLIFFGEPGTDKTNCAALVHFGSDSRYHPMVLVDCTRLDRQALVLYGRGEKRGLLELIGRDGTLLLTNLHRVSFCF